MFISNVPPPPPATHKYSVIKLGVSFASNTKMEMFCFLAQFRYYFNNHNKVRAVHSAVGLALTWCRYQGYCGRSFTPPSRTGCATWWNPATPQLTTPIYLLQIVYFDDYKYKSHP